jgi:hypothetical protein
MADFEALKRDLLAECDDDHVGLWAIIGYVEDEMPTATPVQIRQETLKLVQELLEADRSASLRHADAGPLRLSHRARMCGLLRYHAPTA